MRIIADLHVHSKYSMATSSKMNPLELSEFAKTKGIQLMGTGDITHPKYVEELKNAFSKDDEHLGLYNVNGMRYLLCGEVSNVYFDNNECKKIHQCIAFKTLEELEQFNDIVGKKNNLSADGRPTLFMGADETVEIAKSVSHKAFVFPAHIWTPWFSVYGSNSGYDSIKDCYKDMMKYIKCVETGLSSDPAMNWRIKELDNINLISNSDSHSPEKIGREANILEVKELTYENVICALENVDQEGANRLLETIEFYPEEGKYHYDGHRNCNVSLSPDESKKLKNICPVCRKELTIGVLHRVEELAEETRPLGFIRKNHIPFRKIVPLKQILAQYLNTNENSKKVTSLYNDLINFYNNEINILINVDYNELRNRFNSRLADYIISARIGTVKLIPGYDGVYGIVKIIPSDDEDLRNNDTEKKVRNSTSSVVIEKKIYESKYSSLNDFMN
ncbi:MAG: endonuclease Q family protein [Candidatus Micrarchaeota archaeon]|nr:endonuclease Q family protein [Candidatus Micrarchaeota archaeon]